MDTMLNDITRHLHSRMGAIRPFENLRKVVRLSAGLRSVAVVLANDAFEFGPAADLAFGHRHEAVVEHGVAAADSAMASVSVIMSEPGSYNVVQLVSAEAHEVIQAFAFQCSNETFAEGVRHRSARWALDGPLGRGHNPTRIYPRPQHPNLSLQKLHAGVEPRVEPLHRQGHHLKNYPIHRNFTSPSNPLFASIIIGFQVPPTYLHPQESVAQI